MKPVVVKPADEVTTVGSVLGTPIVVKGITWLPLTQFAVWLIMAWLAGRGRSDRLWWMRLGIGALTMSAKLGSEWCHNLAHAAAARGVGKPMDALRIAWGMPLVVYYDVSDGTVTPRQHIVRALGGPVCNALLLPFALLLRKRAHQGSVLGDVANAAVGMNLFLCTASLLPIPGIDGGPILKWALVERGSTPDEADELVKGADRILAGGLGVAAGDLDAADRHLSEALTRCRGINAVDHEADILLDLARLRRAQGHHDEAQRHADEARAITERSGYALQGADVRLFLAEMAIEEGDSEQALEHARQARALATCDGPPDYTYKVAYEEAGALLAQLGEPVD